MSDNSPLNYVNSFTPIEIKKIMIPADSIPKPIEEF